MQVVFTVYYLKLAMVFIRLTSTIQSLQIIGVTTQNLQVKPATSTAIPKNLLIRIASDRLLNLRAA